MEYFKCKWIHDSHEDPYLLYSELNDERWEVRKIEIFKNNTLGFADSNEHTENTEIGLSTIPSINEINENEEFVAEIISKEEFETLWKNRKTSFEKWRNII